MQSDFQPVLNWVKKETCAITTVISERKIKITLYKRRVFDNFYITLFSRAIFLNALSMSSNIKEKKNLNRDEFTSFQGII